VPSARASAAAVCGASSAVSTRSRASEARTVVTRPSGARVTRRRVVEGDQAPRALEGGRLDRLAELPQEIVEEEREAGPDLGEERIIGARGVGHGQVLDEPRELQGLPREMRMVEGADG
jgi:hypothetical protein